MEEHDEMTDVQRNWAGNIAYQAERIERPSTVDELRQILATAGPGGAHMLGSRHSFNDLADTEGVLIETGGLPVDLVVDDDRSTVTVDGGIRYGELAIELERRGLALANLASLPHISVAGAIATGTHGSGDRVRSLAASVAGLELVTAAGEVVELRRGDADFAGAVVALGALGAVTRVTLDVEPTFLVAQTVYEGLDWETALGRLDEVTGAGYSVSLFTSWRDRDRIDHVWVKSRVTDAPDAPAAPATLFGAPAATGPRHPLTGLPADLSTTQLGVPGPWHERLPHFRLGFTPSNGDELQSEYLVPRHHAAGAISAVQTLAGPIAALLQVCEVRTVAADELWLSPAYGTDVVGIHFTWRPVEAEVRAFLPDLEAALEPFEPRPHWGKVFEMPGDLVAARYPRWADFAELRARYDPHGVFGNAFLARLGLTSRVF
jgi:alditol oxidase